MANIEKFHDRFLDELFRLCALKRDVCEIVCKHLDYEYIPSELKAYKHILKGVKRQFLGENKLPSFGVILQNNANDEEVGKVVDRILKMSVPDKDVVLKTLEEYIKRVRFQILFQKTADLYNEGRHEEAITLQAEESQKINTFSINEDTQCVTDIFNGFLRRDVERYIEANDATRVETKIPFGIDLLDAITYGGADEGETDCFLGRSGSGKTKWLRWRGVSAARRGFKVLHIQAEGTVKECVLGYDATWTGILKRELKAGETPETVEKKLKKIISDINRLGGGIEVVGFEQFGAASMRDVRDKVLDYIKRHGCPPHLLILDYLELFHPGDGRKYAPTTEGEKYKREASARALKNICVEFKMNGATASQVNDIAPSDYNNSSWVMTRHNVAGAKGLPDSFSYFFTWNVSSDEYSKRQGRLYVDKMREYEANQTIRICTDFNHDRFYNRPATVETWPEDFEKKKK